jgi:putative CocE/NonD family hydrolase
LEVIGTVTMELYAASDARDTDFTAVISDVRPDGTAVVLGSRPVGIVRARYRNGREAEPTLLTPGEVERYEIDLGAIGHGFLPGHRVRVEVSSSAAPFFNPNQNMGNPIATDTEWRVANQTIFHDAVHPSALLLPVYEGR